jgi:hypothetical protein
MGFETPECSRDRDYNMPQSEPNGLYMPSTAEGSWMHCANPKVPGGVAVYIEPRVIASPFKMHAYGEWAEK